MGTGLPSQLSVYWTNRIPIRKYNGPNHWNDPDMLEVGNGMSYDEDKSHFSLWCMLAAPLAAGNDLRKMSAANKRNPDQ